MRKITNYLSDGQIVPGVHTSLFLLQLDVFDSFGLRNFLRGSHEISGVFYAHFKNHND